MSKADVLNLVQILSNGASDVTAIDRFYDDVMYELARENWFVDAQLIPLIRGQLEVDLGAAIGTQMVNTLGLIYDDTELEEATRVQMESIDPQWRDAIKYTRKREVARIEIDLARTAKLLKAYEERQQAAVPFAKIRGIEGQAAYVADRSQLLFDRRWRRKATPELPISGEAERQDAALHGRRDACRYLSGTCQARAGS